MPIQKVSEIEGEPKVGQFYIVPYVWRDGQAWPIIGPKHNDREYIGVSIEHWHYDIRFLNQIQIRHLQGRLVPGRSLEYILAFIADENKSSAPAEGRFLCRRQMPEFPVDGLWIPELERAYKDARLTSCLRCPHRGMPLAGMPTKNGVVICNGHGLAFNVKTRRLVSRL